MVLFKIGDIVPADCRLTEATNFVTLSANTFFGHAASLVGQDDDTTGHLQKILTQIGSFCLVSIGVFVILEIVVLYPPSTALTVVD
ncbi:hypothetical protein F5880DRAFT_1623550 [Lentinula raphanica]|nr:hypothetical protein F5880DRAFT_1623550 [Lentinula raphanica]